jgi:flagellar protein FliS
MMSAAARAAAQYQRTDVECGTPLELVVKLYDGAIANVVRARDGASSGDLHKRKDGMSKAMAIVAHLQNTLDMTGGGEVSTRLDALYTYLIGRIVDVNTKKDAKALDEVYGVLVTLRDGWQQIANAPPGAQAQR